MRRGVVAVVVLGQFSLTTTARNSVSFVALPGTYAAGHYLPPRHHKNLCFSDRSRSTSDIARDPSEATKSSLLSFSLVGGLTSRGPWLKV